MDIIIIIIINLTLWRTLQNVIQTQKCVPNQKNQLWTSVFSSVQQKYSIQHAIVYWEIIQQLYIV